VKFGFGGGIQFVITNLFHPQEADSLGHKNRQISCTKFLVTQLSDKMSLPQKWIFLCFFYGAEITACVVLFNLLPF